jgi:hypothetical protein
VARGTFTPGQRSSPTNGVHRAGLLRHGQRLRHPQRLPGLPARDQATLTVSSEALSVSIRTNELIKTGAAELTYIKEFVVMVVDAAGQAKPDVLITPSIDLTGYYKPSSACPAAASPPSGATWRGSWACASSTATPRSSTASAMPIRDFSRQGEDAFRDVEQDVIDELTQRQPAPCWPPAAARCCGRQPRRAALALHVFYLRSTPEELFRRLRHDTQRPLLQVADPLRAARAVPRARPAVPPHRALRRRDRAALGAGAAGHGADAARAGRPGGPGACRQPIDAGHA